MSFVRNQIAGNLRARLAADMTGAIDLTGSPFVVAAARLPAYAVRIAPLSAELAEMGRPGYFITRDRASVFAWAEGDQSTEAALWAYAAEISEIVLRAPEDLGGLVLTITPAGAEVQAFPGERRIWGLEVAVDLLYLETPAAPPEPEPDPALFELDVLFSGHSLVGPDLHWMVRRFIEYRGGAGTSERSFITGSGMGWRWDHDLDAIEVHARARLAEGTTGIFVITEAGPIETHAAWSDSDGYLKLFYDLAVDNGCEHVYFYQTWAGLTSGDGTDIEGDSMDHLPWRTRPMVDLHWWEAIAAAVNALRDPGQPELRQVPMGLAWGRLYDAVQAGETFEVTDFVADLFSDMIHPNSLGFYYVACVHYATIYGQSPVGLPHALNGQFAPFSPQPSAGLAAKMQALAWDVARSYAHSGRAGAALAPDLSYAVLSCDLPSADLAIGTQITVPYHYATGWPAPTLSYAWRRSATVVSTGAAYTPDIAGDYALTLRATNASGTSDLVLAFTVPAEAGAQLVHFDGVTNNLVYSASNPVEFTYVLKFTPRSRASGNRFASSLGFFVAGGAERLFPTLFNTGFGEMLSQFTYGTPGTGYTLVPTAYPDNVPICLMMVGKRDGTLAGGFSVKVVTDGVTVLTSTRTSGNPFYAITQLGEDGGSNYIDMDVEMVWQSNVALEPGDFYSTFFDGSGNVQTLPSNGAVGGNVPIFYQKGNAAVWNSEVDINGHAYTLTGTLTDV